MFPFVLRVGYSRKTMSPTWGAARRLPTKLGTPCLGCEEEWARSARPCSFRVVAQRREPEVKLRVLVAAQPLPRDGSPYRMRLRDPGMQFVPPHLHLEGGQLFL